MIGVEGYVAFRELEYDGGDARNSSSRRRATGFSHWHGIAREPHRRGRRRSAARFRRGLEFSADRNRRSHPDRRRGRDRAAGGGGRGANRESRHAPGCSRRSGPSCCCRGDTPASRYTFDSKHSVTRNPKIISASSVISRVSRSSNLGGLKAATKLWKLATGELAACCFPVRQEETCCPLWSGQNGGGDGPVVMSRLRIPGPSLEMGFRGSRGSNFRVRPPLLRGPRASQVPRRCPPMRRAFQVAEVTPSLLMVPKWGARQLR